MPASILSWKIGFGKHTILFFDKSKDKHIDVIHFYFKNGFCLVSCNILIKM